MASGKEGGPMTEAEWLECESPWDALLSLLERANDRNRMLFACACFRQQWHRIKYQATAVAIGVIERYADGAASTEELAEAAIAASKAAYQLGDETRVLAWAVASVGAKRS